MNEVLNGGYSLIPGAGALIGFGVAFVVIFAIFLAKAFRKVVEPNEVHIVQSHNGTTTYGKSPELDEAQDGIKVKVNNSYYAWPSWWPLIGVQAVVLPLSVFREDLQNYEAYDIGKVPFVVDIVAFFRISDPGMAAKRVSTMQELKGQLTSILQGAVRTILAKHEIEEIMTERSTFGVKFTDEVKEQLKAWGVTNVKNIELMDIRDGTQSKTVSNIMAKKESLIEMQSRTEVAANHRAAEIAEIEARQVVEVRAQEAEQLIGERTAEKDKLVGIANEQAQQDIKVQAKVTAEKDMAVKLVNNVRAAEINREVQVVAADQDKQTYIIRAEGERQKRVIAAEADKAETVLVADGKLQESLKNAEGILAIGTSNAETKRLAEMATVTPQIVLATEIGENPAYQDYLIRIRSVEKDEVVGSAQAKALQDAGIKVIANTGNVNSGVSSVMDLFTSKGGTEIAAMAEAISQTDAGAALLSRLGINKAPETKTAAKVEPKTATKKV